ncbi:hypothetical protein EYF80_028538 [Liparis tanakae]|uniref:Uncharacterized protein n=1 Tax=Liparis tanakae TaxID=230148 RepID=A0A4Z2H893_9TELE|nr:hypothetical protein EYF80_028538 [Liparis tanakae]
MVSESCHRGRCSGGFRSAGEEKRRLSGFRGKRPPEVEEEEEEEEVSGQVARQQLSLGPNFLCTGTSAASCGMSAQRQRGRLDLRCPQRRKKTMAQSQSGSEEAEQGGRRLQRHDEQNNSRATT